MDENATLRAHRRKVLLIAILPIAVVIIFVLLLGWLRFIASGDETDLANLEQQQPVNEISLAELQNLDPETELKINNANQLVINGELKANQAFVIAPGQEPTDPSAGQLFYDIDVERFRYYDGQEFFTIPIITEEQEICFVGADCGFLTAADLPNGLTLPQPLGVGDSPTFAGLTITNDLSVSSGGTGRSSFTNNAILLGNGSGDIDVTNAPAAGQIIVADGSGRPRFVGMGGDVSINSSGLTALALNSVNGSELVDTGVAAGVYGDGSNYPVITVDADGRITNVSTEASGGGGAVTALNTLTGSLTIQGTANQIIVNDNGTDTITLSLPQDIAATSTPTFAGLNLSANLNVNGSTTLGDALADQLTINGAIQGGTPFVFEGATADGFETSLSLADPTADNVIILPNLSGTVCLTSGNCSASGAAGGDLDGTYPNPTVVGLNGTSLNTSALAGGDVLLYNGTEWVNEQISGDIQISNLGLAVIQDNSVELGDDTTGNYIATLAGGSGISVTGSGSENAAATVALITCTDDEILKFNAGVWGCAADNGTGVTAVDSLNSLTGALNLQGTANQITVSDNGSDTITLSLPQDIATTSSPTFGGLTLNGALVANGNLTLGDAAADTLTINATLQGANPLVFEGATADGFEITLSLQDPTADVTYRLLDASAGSYDICTTAGNCIGAGGSAPSDAQFVTLGLDANLSNERVLTSGTNISLVDGGANGNITLNVVDNPSFSGLVSANGGLTATGSVTLSAAEILGANPLVFEGTTADGFETTLAVTNPTADNVITLPNLSGVVCLDSGNCVGAGGSAPSDAQFLVLSLDGNLSAERLLVDGAGLTLVDSGANNNATFNINVDGSTIVINGDSLEVPSGGITTTQIDDGTITGTDIANDTIALGTKTTGNFVATLSSGAGTGITVTNGSGENSAATVSLIDCVEGQILKFISGDWVCDSDAGAGGGGVDSLNTLDGTLNLAGTVNQIIVSDNGTDTITLSLPQDINTTSSPTFGGLTVSGALLANGNVVLGDGVADTLTINATLQGASPFIFEGTTIDTNQITFAITDPSADQTITIPDDSGTICLTSGNCLGGGGGGAPASAQYLTLALDGDLSAERLLQGGNGIDLTDGGANGNAVLALGTLEANWDQDGAFDIILNNAGSELIILESVGGLFSATLDAGDLSGNRTFTLGDNGGEICTDAGNCIGGGGSGAAPADGTYLTLSLNGNLSAERVLTAGTNIGLVDTGADGTLTINVANAPTFSGLVTANGGLTVETGDTFTFNGDAFTDLTGTGLTFDVGTGSLQTTLGTDVDLNSAEVINTLQVGNGGTGAGSFTQFGVLYGNGTSALGATAAGTTGQCLNANTSAAPTWGSCGTGITGSGANGQVSYWTGASTQAGNANFIWDNANTRLGINDATPDATLDVHGDLFISTDGSTAGSPRVGAFADLTAGEAARFQFGDEANAFQLEHGSALDVYSYHTLRLMGDRNSVTAPAFSTESNIGVHVINSVGASQALVVSGSPFQSADLIVAEDNLGTDLFRINASGAIAQAAGITSSGTITFSALTNCDTIDTDGSGVLSCGTDAGSAGITGTGTAGQVSYWTGTSTQGGNNNLFWDTTNSRLGIGITTPSEALEVRSGDILVSAADPPGDGNINSPDLILQSSYDADSGAGYSAARRNISLRNIISGVGPSAPYRLGIIDTTGTEFLSFASQTTDDVLVRTGGLFELSQSNLQLSVGPAPAESNINSPDLVLQSSYDADSGVGYADGRRNITLRNIITGVGPSAGYRLAFLDTAGTEFVTFDGFNQRIGIGGDTTPNSLFNVGATSQFQVNTSGAIQAAAGITSAGTITFSGLTSCGAIQTDGSGVLSCAPGGASLFTDGGTFAYLTTTTDDLVLGGTSVATADIFLGDTGSAVFNEQGLDSDFRVEGDTQANLIFADASTDFVGLRTNTPTAVLDISTTGDALRLRSGNLNTGSASNQVLLSYNASTNYTHAIKSRHDAGSTSRNAIDFYVWQQGIDTINAIGTNQVFTVDGGNFGSIGVNTGTNTLTANLVVNNETSTANIVQIQDNGSTIFAIQDGGAVLIGNATTAAVLSLYDGSSHTATIQTANQSANRTFTIPTAASDEICLLTLANCAGGAVTGTGAAGQVSYWTGASSQGGSSNFFWDNVNNRLGIGVGANTPSTTLEVRNTNVSALQTDLTDSVTNAGILIETVQTSGTFTPGIFWATSNSSPTLPRAGIYLESVSNSDYKLHIGVADTALTGIRDELIINRDGEFENNLVSNRPATSLVETDFTESLTNTGLHIKTVQANGAYTPGVFWSATNSSGTMPFAGIYAQSISNNDYRLILGTRTSAVAGLGANKVIVEPDGNLTVQGVNVTVGTASTAGTLILNDATGQTATIATGNQTANRTYTIPITAGNDTFCLVTLANCAGGGSLFTDGGTFAYLTTTTDDLVLGGTSVATADIFLGDTGSAVFNEQGLDSDFRVEGDTNANLLFVDASTDRVGIGTNTPSAMLDIVNGNDALRVRAGNSSGGTTGNQILLSHSSTASYTHAIKTRHNSVSALSNAIDFYIWDAAVDAAGTTGTNQVLTLEGTNFGSIGVNTGTSNLNANLVVNNETSTSDIVQILDNGLVTMMIQDGGATVFNEQGTSTGDFRVEGDTAANLLFTDASADRVGIGTSTPGLKLEVSNSISNGIFDGLRLTNTAAAGSAEVGIDFYNLAVPFSSARLHSRTGGAFAASDFTIQVANGSQVLQDRFRIDVNGNVGIGDMTPDARLDVESTGAVTTTVYSQQISNLVTNATTDAINKYGLHITSTGSFTGLGGTATNNYGLYVATPTGADNNYAAVFQGGNVGIGTTSPDGKLEVDAGTFAELNLLLTADGGAQADDTWTFNIPVNGGLLSLINNGSTRFSVSSAGVVNFTNYLTTSTGQFEFRAPTAGVANMVLVADNGAQADDTWTFNIPVNGGLLSFINNSATRFSISSAGNVTALGTGAFQGASLSVGTTSQLGTLNLNDGSSHTAGIITADQTGNRTYTIPVTTGNDTFCLVALANCGGGGSLFTDGGTFAYLTTTTDDLVLGGTSVATADIFLGDTGSAVFNEQGLDSDFRVEGDTNANLLFVDASTDRVGIGTNAPSGQFHVHTQIGDQLNMYLVGDGASQPNDTWIWNQSIAATISLINGGVSRLSLDPTGVLTVSNYITSANSQVEVRAPIGTALDFLLTSDGASQATDTWNLNVGTNNNTLSLINNGSTALSLTNTGIITVSNYLTSTSGSLEARSPVATPLNFSLTSDGASQVTDTWNFNVGTNTNTFSIINNSNTYLSLTSAGALTFPAGNLNLGTTTQLGTLNLFDGASNTAAITTADQTGNRTYTIPVAANDTFCLVNLANCSGAAEWTDTGTLLHPSETTDDVVIGGNTTAANILLGGLGNAIFNQNLLDSDFRVAGDTNANLLFVDAGSDAVGIGTNTPDTNYILEIAGASLYGGNIIPDTDDTYDLGSSTNRWQDLYLGPQSLHIGTNGNDGVLGFDTTAQQFEFDTKTQVTEQVTIQAIASQVDSLFQLLDNSGNVNASFNETGAELTLGRIASSGTVSQGKLILADGTTSNFASSLQSGILTANQTYILPDSSGTLTMTLGSGGGGNQTFSYTGTEQQWVVPAGVEQITVQVSGAEGGVGGSASGIGGDGGDGVIINATVEVTPGETLYMYVGGTTTSTTGGWNGGGDGQLRGSGGGGASDIRQGGNTLADRIAVAAGGGGGGGGSRFSGNAGGAGGMGGDPTGMEGVDGTSNDGGGGATTLAGGTAGNAGATAGVLGDGGDGDIGNDGQGGGGGGGGLYGGGGGGDGGTASSSSGGGGGGGSSLVPASGSVETGHNGVGVIEISWLGSGTTNILPVFGNNNSLLDSFVSQNVDTTIISSKLSVEVPESTSATAGTLQGAVLTVTDTGIVTTGTDTTYGQAINVTRTGATGGTINTTGLNINVTGDAGGTSTTTGLNVNVSGADTNYAALFNGGNVGIGTAAPEYDLHIVHDNAATTGNLTIDAYGNTPIFQGRRANGNVGAETAVLTGQSLAQFSGGGYDSVGWSDSRGAVVLRANENWSQFTNGTEIAFFTTATGTTSLVNTLLLNNTSTESRLTINGGDLADSAILQLSNGGIQEWHLRSSGNGGLFEIVESGGATRLAIEETTGDIFIGGTSSATANTIFQQSGAAVFNEQGLDSDFRVEGDTNANLLFVDASTDRVGIGTNTPSTTFHVQGNVADGTPLVTIQTDATSGDLIGGINNNGNKVIEIDVTGGEAGEIEVLNDALTSWVKLKPGGANEQFEIIVQEAVADDALALFNSGDNRDSGLKLREGGLAANGLNIFYSGVNNQLAVQTTDSTNGIDTVFTIQRATGAALFQTHTDAVTGFQVMDADGGTPVLNVDTTNERVGIGTAAPGVNLEVDSETTTSTDTIFRIITDVGSAENVVFRVDADGDIFTDGATTLGQPADVAEKYANYDNAKPGDVVVFADNRTVKKSSSGYQTALAGVVSTEPGLVLSGNTAGVPVALAGRVPVKVTNENGAIKRGDYLTSSATKPGYAMKATSNGATIGMAMSGFSGTTGIIDLWVNTGHYTPNNLQANPTFSSINISGTVTTQNLTVTGTANIANASITNLIVTGTTEVATLTVNGHIITAGNVPTGVAGDAAGTGANVAIEGTDTAGTVSVSTGSVTTSGVLAEITFSSEYTDTPRITLTPVNANAALSQYYVERTAGKFIIKVVSSIDENVELKFDYQIIQ